MMDSSASQARGCDAHLLRCSDRVRDCRLTRRPIAQHPAMQRVTRPVRLSLRERSWPLILPVDCEGRQPMDDDFRRAALDYHRAPQPGKLAIQPTKRMATQRDLSL